MILCWGWPWRPGVGTEMMVIATGREEQRAGIAPHRLVEAETPVVEGFGRVQAPDVQVHVAHGGAGRRTIPVVSSTSGNQLLMSSGSVAIAELSDPDVASVPRPIGVHLDSKAVRILQVERLADEVICHPHADSRCRECAANRPSAARSGSRIAKWDSPEAPRRVTGLVPSLA